MISISHRPDNILTRLAKQIWSALVCMDKGLSTRYLNQGANERGEQYCNVHRPRGRVEGLWWLVL
jgi:hypothetical protein